MLAEKSEHLRRGVAAEPHARQFVAETVPLYAMFNDQGGRGDGMDLGEPLADEGGCVYPRMDCPDDRYLRDDTGGNEARIYRAGEDDGVCPSSYSFTF